MPRPSECRTERRNSVGGDPVAFWSHSSGLLRRDRLRLYWSLLTSDPGDAHTVIRSSTNISHDGREDAATPPTPPCGCVICFTLCHSPFGTRAERVPDAHAESHSVETPFDTVHSFCAALPTRSSDQPQSRKSRGRVERTAADCLKCQGLRDSPGRVPRPRALR